MAFLFFPLNWRGYYSTPNVSTGGVMEMKQPRCRSPPVLDFCPPQKFKKIGGKANEKLSGQRLRAE